MKVRFAPKTAEEKAELNRITKALGDKVDYRIDENDLPTSSQSFAAKALESKKNESQKR